MRPLEGGSDVGQQHRMTSSPVAAFSVGGIRYSVTSIGSSLSIQSATTHGDIDETCSPWLNIPSTVFVVPAADLEDASNCLKTQHARLVASDDDVWQDEFLSTTVVVTSTGSSHSAKHVASCVPWPVSKVVVAVATTDIPIGPYLLHGSKLLRVARLYADPLSAFVCGLNPQDEAQTSFSEASDCMIPVPSRLYSAAPDAQKPLSGKRFAVKDIFHIKGSITGASNRDFGRFYGPRAATAPMVRRIIDAGGIIVGKTKTAQFASGEHARDWVDVFCPFNPRADGYIDPDGSSTGSAAAMAGYAWLDFAIGSDTLGSMVCPAASQGIIGIRSTHGLADTTDVAPVSDRLDTIGFFSRRIIDAADFSRLWYQQNSVATESISLKSPLSLLYFTKEFEAYHADQRDMLDSFVHDLESCAKTKAENFDIHQAWRQAQPPEIDQDIDKYLATTLARIQLWGSYQNNLPFREAFKKEQGHEPYANPLVKFKWGLGEKLKPKEFEAACHEQEIYRKFLLEKVFSSPSTVLVFPAGASDAVYRDKYYAPPAESGYSLQGFGYFRDQIGFLGGCPLLVIPVGQVQRKSEATGAMVSLPLSITLAGPPGSDSNLFALARDVMQHSGRPMELKTGASAF